MTSTSSAPAPRQLIRNGTPADVIATIWYRLGYRPADSLVLMGLDGPRRRLGMCIRGDLPDRPGPAAQSVLVAGLAGPIMAGGARRVLAVVFSDRLLGAGRPPITPATLRREIAAAGGVLVEVIGVTASRYRSLDCRGHRCCPKNGFALSAVESSAAAAAHVVAGQRVVATEAELLADVRPVPPTPSAQPVPASEAARRELWQEWRRALRDGDLPGERAATLAAGLSDKPVRDAVMMVALGCDPEVAAGALGRPEPAAEGSWAECFVAIDEALAVSPEVGDREARIEAAGAVLAVAARHAAAGQRGPVLALMAFLAWYLNSPARARLLVQAAQQDEPHESLAGLVGQSLATLTPPPWVRAWVQGREQGREHEREAP